MARYHHYVPRFYLSHFADVSMIQQVDLRYGNSRKKSIKKVAGLDDFYAIPDEEDPHILEKEFFGGIETKAAPIFDSVVNQDSWPLPADDRQMLAVYLAVQFLRGVDQRDNQTETASLLMRLQLAAEGRDAFIGNVFGDSVEFPEHTVDELWNEIVIEGKDHFAVTPYGHLKLLGGSLEEIIPYFIRRPWILVRFNRKTLLTCDAPVSLIPHPDSEPHMGVGLMTSHSILFPISRRVGLMLGDPMPYIERNVAGEDIQVGKFDSSTPGTTAVAGSFNAATTRNAHRYIFHHPEDRHLLPDALPAERASTIEAVGAEGMIRSLAEQGGFSLEGDPDAPPVR